jgi:8-oxo-dGTP pyrophosphatase MutT (NUDIX family)
MNKAEGKDRGCQCAALPYRKEAGELQVMLVTSRGTGRWVLPKGWPEKGKTLAEQAAREAFEEAGIVGLPCESSIGTYAYSKQTASGDFADCVVEVFPLRVVQLLDTWPECEQRRRQWFTPAQAAMAVDEGGLVTLLVKLGTP